MTQKKTHQSKKANGVTKAATVRLANGLTGSLSMPIPEHSAIKKKPDGPQIFCLGPPGDNIGREFRWFMPRLIL